MDRRQSQGDKRVPIVMVVDDNPAIRNVVSWSLQLGGYQPVEAANGWEAIRWLEQAQQQKRYPAAILLDLAMPGMNGETFLQWVQSTWPQGATLPSIIIVTAGYTEEQMSHSLVKQVVTKPFHMRDLLEIIRKWVAF